MTTGPADSAHEVDFQHIPTGGFFGECTLPTRRAAEEFALGKLIGLGEGQSDAEDAVRLAGYTAADARTYGVRIYAVHQHNGGT